MAPKKKLLIGLGIAGGLLILYGPGLIRWVELKIRQSQLQAESVRLAKENRRLYEETQRLRDPSYAEAVARGQLGLVRPGETKVTFRRGESSDRR